MENKQYLKIFETPDVYTSNINMMGVPHVVLIEDGENVVFCNDASEVNSREYFTIESLENGLTVKLSLNNSYYRIGSGNWTELSAETESPIVNKGQKIQFKITDPTTSYVNGIGTFSVNKQFNVKGNIMSLVYGDNFIGNNVLKTNIFRKLFNFCTTLKSAKYLVLPATKLTTGCYKEMFCYCESLTTAPELPATDLAIGCYDSMFFGCFSLTAAPALPATIMKEKCYSGMFYSCESLTTAPELPATDLAKDCYKHMLGYTSITSAPALPATTLVTGCYSCMFQGCFSLKTAPVLPATIMKSDCYSYMFYNCSSLTAAPALPATTLATNCYSYMFYCCTSLTAAPALPATTSAEYCYSFMFQGCSSLKSVPTLPAPTLATGCYRDMFNGCTSITTAPDLNATKLSQECYANMFFGCTKLNSVKMFAMNIGEDSLHNWLYGVSSSGTFTKRVELVSLSRGSSGIPINWIVKENGVAPSIINAQNISIDFNYNGGIIRPNKESHLLLSSFTQQQLISLQATCDIRVDLYYSSQTGSVSNLTLKRGKYLWKCNRKLESILLEIDSTTNYAKNYVIVITNIYLPEDGGYYYNQNNIKEPFVEKDWLKITSNEDNNVISLTKDIKYSINKNYWKTLSAGSSITVDKNDIVYFKGTAIQNQFKVTKAFDVSGNVMSMIYDNDFVNVISLSNKTNAFRELFINCKTLINAQNLKLPAKTLSTSCYAYMFKGCSELITTPTLSATTLAQSCYIGMFQGCISLTKAPVLPATTLAPQCYSAMFSGCSSLTTAPDLPATTLASYCYSTMFSGCSSLTSAPELRANVLANSCYSEMFKDCYNLSSVMMLATNIEASNCLNNWLFGTHEVSQERWIIIMSTMIYVIPSNSDSGIPEGWKTVYYV